MLSTTLLEDYPVAGGRLGLEQSRGSTGCRDSWSFPSFHTTSGPLSFSTWSLQWGTWTSQMAVQTSRSEYSKRRKRKLPALLKTMSKTYATYIPCDPCVSMHPRPARIQCGGTTQGIDTRRSWSLGFGRKIACLSSSHILKSRETISKCPLPDRPPQHQA